MEELTRETLQAYRAACLTGEDDPGLAEKLRSGPLSDLAFNEEKARKQPFAFSVDIPTMEAVSQGQAGRCWVFAGLNLLRETAVRKMDRASLPGGSFRFSAAYLCFWDKVEKVNCFLEKAIQYRDRPSGSREVLSWFRYGVTDGGFWTCFADLVSKYGLVPAEVMPETFQSANTEEMNSRLNSYLRKVGADIRNAHREGAGFGELRQLKEQAMENSFRFLCRCYGCPPEEFVYTYTTPEGAARGGSHTPLSFRDELLGGFPDELVSVISLPYEDLPFGRMCVLRDVFGVVGMHEERFLNLPLDELRSCCIAQLKDGIPVVCTADDDQMCREELQLWDNASFDDEKVTGLSFAMSRKDRFQLKASTACHSMLITGVHLDEDGRPLRWKIENSYGVSGLHGGYFTCSDSWFGKYMVSAVIRRDYLRPYESRLNEPAHPFHIWDIL